MKISRAEGLPMWWDAAGDRWIVQSDLALGPEQLLRLAHWMLHHQLQRRMGMMPGDLRDDLDRSVVALRAGRVVCGLPGGDVFKSTQRATDNRFLDLGA